MKSHNLFLIVAAIISLSILIVGLIFEIQLAKGFGLLSLGYPIGYLLGILIKSNNKPKLLFKPTFPRILLFVLILIITTYLFVFFRQFDKGFWINNLITIVLLILIVTAFFMILFKREINNK